MIYDCIIHILSFVKFKRLIQLHKLNKNFYKTIHIVIRNYSQHKMLNALRYTISVDNIYLFKSLQHYIHRKYMFYLLRYASHKKNLSFVEHILIYTDGKLIRRCINDMIRVYRYNQDSLYIIYKLYFFLILTDNREAGLINSYFFKSFYKFEYTKIYDEFNYRWRMFEMEF